MMVVRRNPTTPVNTKFDALVPDLFEVRVTASHFESTTFTVNLTDEVRRDVSLTLETPWTVAGTVTDEARGLPLANVRVEGFFTDFGSPGPDQYQPLGETLTDAAGHYSLSGFPWRPATIRFANDDTSWLIQQEFAVQMMDQDLLQTDIALENARVTITGSICAPCSGVSEWPTSGARSSIIDGINAGKSMSDYYHDEKQWYIEDVILPDTFTLRISNWDDAVPTYETQDLVITTTSTGEWTADNIDRLNCVWSSRIWSIYGEKVERAGHGMKCSTMTRVEMVRRPYLRSR